MKKLVTGTLALTSLWMSPVFASLEITCQVPESNAVVIVKNSANPQNTDPQQAPSTFEVRDNNGTPIGQGEFTLTAFEFDSFLNTMAFMFQSENAVVGVALDSMSLQSLSELQPGTYSAKSDLFITYGDNQFVDGNTLNCTLASL